MGREPETVTKGALTLGVHRQDAFTASAEDALAVLTDFSAREP